MEGIQPPIKEGPKPTSVPPTALNYFRDILAKKQNAPGNLAESVSHPDYLNPKEKIAFAIMMTRELTVAGKETPLEIKDLAVNYMQLLADRQAEAQPAGVVSRLGELNIAISEDPKVYKENYILDRTILALLTKIKMQKATLSMSEQDSLRNSLLSRLKKAGIDIDQSVDSDELLSAYQQFREQEIRTLRSRWDYDRFCQEHPYRVINDMQVNVSPREEYNPPSGHIEIEQSIGVQQPVAILTAFSKQEDAVGISVIENGRINIAIADGITNTVVPKVASREAVAAALEDMSTNAPSQDTLRAAYNKIQEHNLGEMTLNKERQVKDRQAQEQDPKKKVSLSNEERNYRDFRERGKIAGTTLAMAQYDRQSGHLSLVVKGDSPAVIFKSNGKYEVYKDPSNSQLLYDLQPSSTYQPAGEVTRDLQLDPDDLVVICSDGLEDEMSFEVINNFLTSVRGKNEGERLDLAVINFIKEKLRAGANDDVSVVALHHK